MAQHLWRGFLMFRMCEVCHAMQSEHQVGWTPPVGPICSGDPDDNGGQAQPGIRDGEARPPSA